MNKTIIININGIVFHIEEDAYDVLRSYMIDVKRHFGNTADSHEIVGDIENRIAEMFNERIIQGRKEVITMADVEEVIAQMGRVSDFETGNTAEDGQGAYGKDYSYTSAGTEERKLMRDPDDRVFGGVCSGLGHYFGIEAKWIRLILVLLVIAGGTGVLFYIILWAVIPVARTRADRMAMRGKPANLENFKRSFDEEMEGLRTNFSGAGASLGRGLNSAGSFLGKTLIIIAKIIGVLIIIGMCGGLVTLLISVVASFGFFGADADIAMFPLNVIEPEYRTPTLISALVVAIIPIFALVALIIRILFNNIMIGRYTGFTMLIIWLIAVGFTTVYATRTINDFREESTIVEEVNLEVHPVYHLSRNDVTVIRIEQDSTDRKRRIRARTSIRSSNFLSELNRVQIYINRVDSLELPTLVYEYEARGASYERAVERASGIQYHVQQQSGKLIFDSHFQVSDYELMRDQRVRLRLNIPVGSHVVIDRDLQRYIVELPFGQCHENYEHAEGLRPDKTEWIMTKTGLKCKYDAPKSLESTVESEMETDTAQQQDTPVVDSLHLDTPLR